MERSAEFYDVAVIGGGCAGICAAIQAGRLGRRTILVEKNGMCGGTLTVGGVNYPGIFSAWGRPVIAGIGWELVRDTCIEMNEAIPDLTTPTDMNAHYKAQILVNPLIFALLADEKHLAAGRIIASDRGANSAIRVQAVCMATGQAAGVLAALACREDVEPRDLPIQMVQEALRGQGAIV